VGKEREYSIPEVDTGWQMRVGESRDTRRARSYRFCVGAHLSKEFFSVFVDRAARGTAGQRPS
jgi:hypothetical protein